MDLHFTKTTLLYCQFLCSALSVLYDTKFLSQFNQKLKANQDSLLSDSLNAPKGGETSGFLAY